MKTGSWDANIRAEAEIEVVRCAIQQRGDGGAWEQGMRKRATEDPKSHFFFLPFFSWGLKANDLSYLTAKATTKPSQTYILTFFFWVCEVLSEEGAGNYFYMRHLFYLKPLLKCWLDLLSVARRSTKWDKKKKKKWRKEKAGATGWFCQGPSR